MSTDCTRFRAELEEALARPSGALLRLADTAHARGCDECRQELARELGLERLLARVPVPQVPPALARRVLAGLAGDRLAAESLVPEIDALANDVLANVELEQLLGSVPAPVVPAGLAGRVLVGLAPARTPALKPRSRRPRLWLAAAGLLAAAALWAWNARRPSRALPEVVQGSRLELDTDLETDEELLAYAVEHWELLHDEDLDVWLASLDPVDELLMEYSDDEGLFADGADEPAASGKGD